MTSLWIFAQTLQTHRKSPSPIVGKDMEQKLFFWFVLGFLEGLINRGFFWLSMPDGTPVCYGCSHISSGECPYLAPHGGWINRGLQVRPLFPVRQGDTQPFTFILVSLKWGRCIWRNLKFPFVPNKRFAWHNNQTNALMVLLGTCVSLNKGTEAWTEPILGANTKPIKTKKQFRNWHEKMSPRDSNV